MVHALQTSSALNLVSQKSENLGGYLPVIRHVGLSHLVRPLVVTAPSLHAEAEVVAVILMQ
jgi:hypothetical protein